MLRGYHSDSQYRMPASQDQSLRAVLARIPDSLVQVMREEIDSWADALGQELTEYFASNWKTGADWSEYKGGVFQPLYDAVGDERQAALLLGSLIRNQLNGRTDREWLFSHDPDAGTEAVPRNMWGTFYWRADRD